ncbi:hypothetical protein ACN28S_11030 [Cystobacter fuscus]
MLDERLGHALEELRRKLDEEGKLHSRAQLEGFYALFRERFGPSGCASWTGTSCCR